MLLALLRLLCLSLLRLLLRALRLLGLTLLGLRLRALCLPRLTLLRRPVSPISAYGGSWMRADASR